MKVVDKISFFHMLMFILIFCLTVINILTIKFYVIGVSLLLLGLSFITVASYEILVKKEIIEYQYAHSKDKTTAEENIHSYFRVYLPIKYIFAGMLCLIGLINII